MPRIKKQAKTHEVLVERVRLFPNKYKEVYNFSIFLQLNL